MTTTAKSPALATIAPNDSGARLAHLQDLIERNAGVRREGLVSVHHEASGAGAMHSIEDRGVVVVTFITREGTSHAYSLTREVAAHLREQLSALRHTHAKLLGARGANLAAGPQDSTGPLRTVAAAAAPVVAPIPASRPVA